MRVPSNLALTFLPDALGRIRQAQERAVASAASGRKPLRPSDDPEGMARATSLRSELKSHAAQTSAAVHGRSSLEAADTTLARMVARLEDALAAGTRGASDLTSAEGRRALADEIRNVAVDLLADANRKQTGYALFAGGRTLSVAFSQAPDGSFAYQGDGLVREIELDGIPIALNVPGDRILTGTVNAGAALETLAAAVEAGDTDAVVAALADVEASRQQVEMGRFEVGQAMARMERAEEGLLAHGAQLTARLSEVEDADMVEVASELTRLENFLQTAMRASTKLEHGSLFDLLV